MSIIINNLSINYQDKEVIKGFSATIDTNEKIALTGPSGIGKTSIINAILGLIPYKGSINCAYSPEYAVVFQEDRLCLGLSVYTNIKLTCPKMSRQDINSYIHRVGLEPSTNVNTLSGGMKRRVAILRALLAPANILIMDEPFKGLDSDTKELVMSLTKEKASDKTMILITHDPSEAQFFNCRPLDISAYV